MFLKNYLIVFFLASVLFFSALFASDNPDYILGPGDEVFIEIFDQLGNELIYLYKEKVIGYKPFEVGEKFNENRFSITYAGIINMPLLGQFKVKNKKIADLEKEIAEAAKIYDADPRVVINILDVKNINVYVMGAVSAPGLYKIPEDGYSNNLAALVAKAGGYSNNSNRSHIVIERDGRKEEVALDDQARSKYVLNNDTHVYVPNKKEFVFIFGEVSNLALNGVKVYDPALTLSDYIAYAGGFTRYASKDVYIINDKENKENNVRVKMNEFLAIKEATGKVEIKPGTIIYVPKNFIAKWRDVFSDLILFRETIKYPQTFDDATTYYFERN